MLMQRCDTKTTDEQALVGETTKKIYNFSPCNLHGTLYLPPSKSYLHRYLLAGVLANTPLTLHGVTTIADDVKVTLEILQHFGFYYIYNKQTAMLQLTTAHKRQKTIWMNMKESGSSLRLFLPTLIHQFEHVELIGENQLPKRPLAPYIETLTDARFRKTTEDNLPLQVEGTITAKDYIFEQQMSSQFVSGLLFVLPLLTSESTITLKLPPLSLPYIQMTLEVLTDFQINIQHNETYTSFTIPGHQRYTAPVGGTIHVEPDYSARAFWDVAKNIGHASLGINPVPAQTVQGDAVLAQIIEDRQTDIDISHIPDLAPILALYFSQTTGGVLHNVHVLTDKESDRLAAIIDFLTRAAIPFVHIDDTLQIGTGDIQGGLYDTWCDHRIAMMLIIASTVARAPIQIREIMSIDKSYPTFIEHYQQLGGIIYEQ